jgi:hypothetical protein
VDHGILRVRRKRSAAVRLPRPRSDAPFGGGHGGWSGIPSCPVTRTRALAIDADARQARDNVAALMTWAIGIVGICLMLAIDMLMFQAV